MFDEYVMDMLTRNMLDEMVSKENLKFLDESYLTGVIKDLYEMNGVVRIELLGNSRYSVIGVIYYLNNILSKILVEGGIEMVPEQINKILVVEGNTPNNFILESDVNNRSYGIIRKGSELPKVNLVLEVLATRPYTSNKEYYLTILYDRRYNRKGFLDVAGALVETEHYRISDEVAYTCLPINHNLTRY